MPKPNQVTMALDVTDVQTEWKQLHHVLSDRGSKYSVTLGRVTNNEKLKQFIKRIKSNKRYAKATHNSYAARVTNNNQVYDVKNDDGETGAGMVILRILQKQNLVNLCIVVTRWYGGVKLHGDRFKHLQDCTITVIDNLI